jgi:Thioredoxin-like domain
MFEIKSLPTFVLFRHGKHERFPMLTTGEAYVAALDKLLDFKLDISPVKTLTEGTVDVAQWIFWRGTSDGKIITTLVLYDPPAARSTPASIHFSKVFANISMELLRFTNLRFARVDSVEVMTDFEIPTDKATLVLYKDHDEGRVEYQGEVEEMKIRNWISAQDTPLATIIWHKTLQNYRKRVNWLCLFFLTDAQMEDYFTVNNVKNGLVELGYKLEKDGLFKRGEYTTGIVDGKKYHSWMTQFGHSKDSKLPLMGCEDTTLGLLYTVPDFSRDAEIEGEVLLKNKPKSDSEDDSNEEDPSEKFEVKADGSFEHKLEATPLVTVGVPIDQLHYSLKRIMTSTVKPFQTVQEADEKYKKRLEEIKAEIAEEERLSEEKAKKSESAPTVVPPVAGDADDGNTFAPALAKDANGNPLPVPVKVERTKQKLQA